MDNGNQQWHKDWRRFSGNIKIYFVTTFVNNYFGSFSLFCIFLLYLILVDLITNTLSYIVKEYEIMIPIQNLMFNFFTYPWSFWKLNILTITTQLLNLGFKWGSKTCKLLYIYVGLKYMVDSRSMVGSRFMANFKSMAYIISQRNTNHKSMFSWKK